MNAHEFLIDLNIDPNKFVTLKQSLGADRGTAIKLTDLLDEYIKFNNGVLADVIGTCCENPKHATEVNDMFESWTYCKNCDKDII